MRGGRREGGREGEERGREGDRGRERGREREGEGRRGRGCGREGGEGGRREGRRGGRERGKERREGERATEGGREREGRESDVIHVHVCTSVRYCSLVSPTPHRTRLWMRSLCTGGGSRAVGGWPEEKLLIRDHSTSHFMMTDALVSMCWKNMGIHVHVSPHVHVNGVEA